MPTLHAGRLRHRITIQRRETTQVQNGDISVQWINAYTNVPAAVEPLSVREFIASQAAQSQVTLRVVIRYLPDLTADMRILHGSKVYNPQGWLPDQDSGLEYLTAPCTEGTDLG